MNGAEVVLFKHSQFKTQTEESFIEDSGEIKFFAQRYTVKQGKEGQKGMTTEQEERHFCQLSSSLHRFLPMTSLLTSHVLFVNSIPNFQFSNLHERSQTSVNSFFNSFNQREATFTVLHDLFHVLTPESLVV